jgi:hypothetical protein
MELRYLAMKGSVKKVIDFAQILDLRKVAADLRSDLPHLPFLLELTVLGMSRYSIANLRLDDIKDGVIYWSSRRHTDLASKLSEGQAQILDDYLSWRRTRNTKSSILLLVKRSIIKKTFDDYFFPIKPERARSDIRSLGREIDLDFVLEIPDIHRSVARYLSESRVDSKFIKKHYKVG